MASKQTSPQSSPEEVFRTHYAELSRLVSDSSNRLALAPELFSTRLISVECFNSATDNSPKSDMEKGLLLMKGLMSTIKSQPLLLTKLIDSLRKIEAFMSVAKKMQRDLSYIPDKVVVTSRNKDFNSPLGNYPTHEHGTSPNEISFTKKLSQHCKGNVIKDSKYNDQQVNGHHMAESKDDPHSQSYIELGKLVCSNPGALGIAIIIANDYDNKKCKELKIKKIEGPFKDAQKAELVFRSFHTICYTLVNRTAQQTMQALLAAASYPYPDTYKWIVFIFSGHGQSELALYAQDGNTISIQVIIDLFQPKSTPQNGNIPKLFFIDACRGNEETETVLVPRGETDGVPIPREGKTLETLRLPSKCNTLVGYSTLPHKIAYEADNGGLWMSFLLERLEQQDNSVVEILTEVNGDVVQHYQDVEGKMQAPEYRSTLLQNVWFKKEVEVRGKKDSITPLEHPSIPDPSWLDGISFTQKLNQLCKKSVLKDRKYTDQQGDGYHVILIITLTDGTDMEFNSSTIKLCFDCINDAREAVARHAVEFLQQNPIVTPPIHPTPSPTSPTPTTMPSTHDPITKLTSRGKGLPPLKKCVEELKNFIVDKKRLEAPCYIEIPVDGEQQFRCSVKHQLFGEIIGDLQRSKKDAKQSAAKKALEHLQAKGLL